jgi:fucose permease
MGKFNSKEKLLLASFAAAWIVYAVFTTLYGSEATVMMRAFSIGSPEQGLLTTVQCVGGMGVSLLCVFFGEKMNKLWMIGLGILLLITGSLLTVLSASYMQVMLFALVAGIGYTLMDIMENAAAVEVFKDRSKTALPILHMTFGIGAMAGPYFLVASVVDPNMPSTFSRPFLIVAIAAAAVFVLFMVARSRMLGKAKIPKPVFVAAYNPGGIFRFPAVWIMLAAGVLYFTFQRGIMTWYPTYLSVTAHVDFNNSVLALTLFLVGSLACRIASPFLFSRFNILKMTIVMTLLCGVFMLASVALAPVSYGLAMAFSVTGGVLQGAFVAAFVFLICHMFPGMAASASSVVLIAINIAGISAPVWMASAAGTANDFTVPLYIVCFMLFGSAALIALAHKINRKQPAAQES